MKKFLCVLILFAVCVSSVLANSLSYIRNGEFTYYLDTRGKSNYARGYLVYHAEGDYSFVFMSVVNLDDGKKWRIVARGNDNDEGKFNFTKLNGLEQIPEEIRGVVTQSVPDFLNFNDNYQKNKEEIGFDTKISDYWDEKLVQYYHYNKILPLFKFSHISVNDSEQPVVLARLMGTIPNYSQESLNMFFNMDISEFKPSHEAASVKIPQAKKIKVRMNGYEAAIDKNWELNKFEGNDSWWLKVQTLRDAMIMVENFPERIPLATPEQRLEIAKILIANQAGILPYSIKVSETKKSLTFQYESYDDKNIVTVTRMTLVPGKCLNFSAYKDIFEENKDYFETVISSLKKIK